MKKQVIYIHGKGGNAAEAKHYKPLFEGWGVIGFDYASKYPWEAVEEFPAFFDRYSAEFDSVTVIANSIGAFFAMSSLGDRPIEKALFISPIVDMERLICDMMLWTNVTEEELRKRGEIVTDIGETLSWEYLCYVREHPIKWNVPTCVLYGENDALTSLETVSCFCDTVGAALSVMPKGEHWFHTPEQMEFLDSWVKKSI